MPGLAMADEAPPPLRTGRQRGVARHQRDHRDRRRRARSLQTTPVAITAVSAAMLENKASVNIGDLQGRTGLLITQQNSGAQAANLSIRGLTYADIEKSQTPTVGVVVMA
jgi:iron complex outermembrane receptor protein